jgi:hypothetical protein
MLSPTAPNLPLLLPEAQVPVRDRAGPTGPPGMQAAAARDTAWAQTPSPERPPSLALCLLLRRRRWARGSGFLSLRARSPGATAREGVGVC